MLHHWHGTADPAAARRGRGAFDPTSAPLLEDLASDARMMAEAASVHASVDVTLAAFREVAIELEDLDALPRWP